ncbi:MAG: hypothetical protein MUP81_02855 [Dehalococcoidia bacterium]|nr:hypothetical protein [Dehalococcoidia bacterium]
MRKLTTEQKKDLHSIGYDAEAIVSITDECLGGELTYLEALRQIHCELQSIEKAALFAPPAIEEKK